ncbi:MAG: spheroidene monooxygenase, partial [Ilumatobacteraceae bacterium]
WRGRSIPVPDASHVDVGGPRDPGAGRPVVVLTRATVRARHWWAFGRMSVHVDRALRPEPGLRAIVGIGETPVGRTGTLSVWDSAAAARSFAAGIGHDAARRAERADHWFAEELFAWCEPIASDGAWDGHDPLAVPGSPRRPTHT